MNSIIISFISVHSAYSIFFQMLFVRTFIGFSLMMSHVTATTAISLEGKWFEKEFLLGQILTSVILLVVLTAASLTSNRHFKILLTTQECFLSLNFIRSLTRKLGSAVWCNV